MFANVTVITVLTWGDSLRNKALPLIGRYCETQQLLVTSTSSNCEYLLHHDCIKCTRKKSVNKNIVIWWNIPSWSSASLHSHTIYVFFFWRGWLKPSPSKHSVLSTCGQLTNATSRVGARLTDEIPPGHELVTRPTASPIYSKCLYNL